MYAIAHDRSATRTSGAQSSLRLKGSETRLNKACSEYVTWDNKHNDAGHRNPQTS